jgi:CTP synthase (UTP-ammonia lyase)
MRCNAGHDGSNFFIFHFSIFDLRHVETVLDNHNMSTIRIGIIGDFQKDNPTHVGTNAALDYSGMCSFEWLATDAPQDYSKFDGLICSPGSPYRSEHGALAGIQYAREHGVPLLGTCGGSQHIILEYARNAAGLPEAAHAENDPDASVLFVTRLACSLVGKTMRVRIAPGTLARRCYGSETADEQYYCNFGLNPEYRQILVDAGLAVSGSDENNEVRIVELHGHPFFVGTLFVPQMRSTREHTHRLIEGLCRASEVRSSRAEHPVSHPAKQEA